MSAHRPFVLGLILGIGVVVVGLLVFWPSPSPEPITTPVYARFDFDIIDSVTGESVEAEITIRRTTIDGSLIEPEKFYSGSQLTIEAPVDPCFTWILVEADGYQDWELRVRPKKPGDVSGPIRLILRDLPPETPSLDVQGW